MNEIPAFSIFSAVSELFVTTAVLYAIISNMRGNKFNWKLMGAVLVFETCFNIVYMVKQAAKEDVHTDITGPLKAMLAVHGIMALVMFVALLVVYLISTFNQKSGYPTWFQQHRNLSYVFITLWVATIGMGEFAFAWLYLPIF